MFHRYFAGIALGVALGAISLVLNIEASKGKPIENGRWVAECLAIKDDAVRKLSPDLVIVSGSNGLFGFSAKRLTEKYGVRTVNAAIHAGLGIEYILYYARRYLKPGRVIVLPLEYELYAAPSAGDVFTFQALNYDHSFLTKMSFHQRLAFAASRPIGTHWILLKNQVWPQAPRSGGYDSKTLNEYGDETKNDWPDTERESKVKHLEQSLGIHARREYEHNNQAWLAIEEFILDAQGRGAAVVLMHPNRFEKSINLSLNEGFFRELSERARNAGSLLLGDPEERLYDSSRLYDTYYHQNSLGQAISTDILFKEINGIISRLKQAK